MRLAAYAGVSSALAAGALVKAFSQRPNFYSATVYLSQSNACILILTNLALVATISFIYAMQRLCYGKLRPIEIEQLSEKAWYAVLDTLLAMPSLRDDVGGWLLAVFVLLLAGKVWAWIAEGRIDMLEQQPPQNPRLFHIRLSTSLIISVIFNTFLCKYCAESVWDNPRRPGMMIIFAFEFAIQTIFSLFTASRYLLALHDARVVKAQTLQRREEVKAELRRERLQVIRSAGQDESTLVEPTDEDVDDNEIDVPGWEDKRRYLFGLELATDALKLFFYTLFFAISLTFIGLPMHIVRDVYITVVNFSKRVQDYSNYRRATRDMNSRYPDANAEELVQENTCIVCRDTMMPWVQQPGQQPSSSRLNEGLRAKKLPCGHILHLRCLKAWLERQQTCPTCRGSVLPQTSSGTTPPAPAPPLAPRVGVAPAPNLPDQVPQVPAAVAAAARGQAQPLAQQPRPRRDRMRWLNMGPVRLGFYNGPAGEVQEAMRQRALQDVGTPRSEAGGHRYGRVGQRCERHLSNDDHLRTVELRLLQQAHNMDVDRAHLAHVRTLEAEIARLRTLRISSRSNAASNIPAFGQTVAGEAATAIPAPLAASPVRYQADSTRQPSLTSGNAALPSGLVLPDGWSLVPLQRHGQAFSQEPMIVPPQFFSSTPAPPTINPSPLSAPWIIGPNHESSIATTEQVPNIPANAVNETVAIASSAHTPMNAANASSIDGELPGPSTMRMPINEASSGGLSSGFAQNTGDAPPTVADAPTWGFDNVPGPNVTDSSPNVGVMVDAEVGITRNRRQQQQPEVEDVPDDSNT